MYSQPYSSHTTTHHNIQIEKYIDLRIGEVWEDMAEELESEQVRPVSPDLEMIRGAIQQTQGLAATLQKSQRALVEQTTQVCLLYFFVLFFPLFCLYIFFFSFFGTSNI